ncbi:hypothetical protein GBA52_015935 [Prunus armeniaca]|nr:hypothetical protein GBA52_015935 [Prunus armeniaca]
MGTGHYTDYQGPSSKTTPSLDVKRIKCSLSATMLLLVDLGQSTWSGRYMSTPTLLGHTGKIVKSVNNRRMKSMGKWFHHKEFTSSTVKKKDKERVERARLPSPLQELLQPWLLSAADIQSPGDLMTLTAAAATGYRKNAAISPYDRGMAEIPSAGAKE